MEAIRNHANASHASRATAVAEQPAITSQAHGEFARLREHMNREILGQEALVDRLLIALLADGHLLVEGAPGLAKTTAVKVLAAGIEGSEQRIQFTPDLLPADLTGTEIYRAEDASFRFRPGPIMHNVVLADEINRAPAKVQSALLEAMAERQVTVGCETYPLPPLFLVMATQNPIEHEGTYPLPEAQLDRFLMFTKIGYPDVDAERKILRLVRDRAQHTHAGRFAPVAQETIFAARRQVLAVHCSPALEEYIVQLAVASRSAQAYGADIGRWIEWGASPRGTLALDKCARAHAWLAGRDYVLPEDVHAIALDVLRHRILLTYDAQADGVSTDEVVIALLARVPLP